MLHSFIVLISRAPDSSCVPLISPRMSRQFCQPCQKISAPSLLNTDLSLIFLQHLPSLSCIMPTCLPSAPTFSNRKLARTTWQISSTHQAQPGIPKPVQFSRDSLQLLQQQDTI